MSLALPLVFLAGVHLFRQTVGTNRIAFAIAFAVICGFMAILLTIYAALRLNAAALARERAMMGNEGVQVHPPFKGPWLLRRSLVPGSTRSRLLSGLPGCVSFGILFALMSYGTSGSAWTILHLPLGALLALQVILAATLFEEDRP